MLQNQQLQSSKASSEFSNKIRISFFPTIIIKCSCAESREIQQLALRRSGTGGKWRPPPFSPDSLLSIRPLVTCCGASYGSRPPRWGSSYGLPQSDRRSPRKGGGRHLHEAGPGWSPRGRVAPLLDLTWISAEQIRMGWARPSPLPIHRLQQTRRLCLCCPAREESTQSNGLRKCRVAACRFPEDWEEQRELPSFYIDGEPISSRMPWVWRYDLPRS